VTEKSPKPERVSGARILRRATRERTSARPPTLRPPDSGSLGSGVVLTRVSSALASPLSVLIVVPGLVLIVGLALGLLAQWSLRGSNLEVARARLSDQAEHVARNVRLTLAQADPVLESLAGLSREHDPERDFHAFGRALADLMRGRAGVTYVSASFPDGTFQGAYLNEDKRIEFQDSRITPQGTRVRRYAVEARPILRFLSEEYTQYDPRQRGFYQSAARAQKAVWTEPYPFYKTRITGITRAAPLYRDTANGRELGAVLTVDYDVQAMSRFLSARKLPDVRAVLYAHRGEVLAYASDDGRTVPIPHEERTLRFADLADPVLSAYYARAKQKNFAPQAVSRVVVEGTPYLAAVARASDDPELDWSVAYLAPESTFLRALHRYQRQGATTSTVVLLVAFLVAWLFARHVTRARREIEVAKAEAKRAQNEVRELGSYRLVSCLGKGGMGEVWRAHHRLLSREAAIKLIRPSEDGAGPSRSELKARFRREAEVLSSLRSRNTIELFDYGVTDDETFFFVMELLDGMDLETLVNRHGAQPWSRAVPLLIQACASLAEAHDAGLVHRDIKPANIFVCRAADELDVVKVLDFGLVRTLRLDEDRQAIDLSEVAAAAEGQLTMSGSALGTPGFMSPEQTLGVEIDARADLYALGCVAVWLLSGRLLFDHENPLHRLVATMTEEIPDLSARIPGAPEPLLALLRALLSKKPDDRPASAREVMRALRAIPLDPTRWNEERARAWWREHVPPLEATIDDAQSARSVVVAE
jgi:serine/threonine protein kinase